MGGAQRAPTVDELDTVAARQSGRGSYTTLRRDVGEGGSNAAVVVSAARTGRLWLSRPLRRRRLWVGARSPVWRRG